MLTSGGAAAAGDEATATGRAVISWRAVDIEFGAPTAACPFGAASFAMRSPDGAPLGRGRACFRTFAGCDPFFVGCRQRAVSLFALRFSSRGLVRARAHVREVTVTQSRLVQWVTGRVVGGTGAFADGRGVLRRGGTVAFTPAGVDPDLHYVVRVR